MSDPQQPPFVSTNAPIAPTPASAEHFEQQFYAPQVTMPEMASYGMAYNDFFMPNDMQSNVLPEQYYERSECVTPLSQHSFVDHASVASDITGSSLQASNLELMSSHSMSSPGTFVTPTWTPEPMQYEDHRETSLSAASPLPHPHPLSRHQHTNSTDSTMTIKPPPARIFTPIAPQPTTPISKQSLKRTASREDLQQQSPRPKRKRSASPTISPSTELSAEDELLLRLKDQEELTWKEIQGRFQSDLNKSYQIPALQMRLKRLKERMRAWTEADVEALRQAYDFWHDHKFEIISAKMMEFGAQEKWSAKQCFKKWHEITPQPDYFQPSFHSTPTFHPVNFSPVFMPPVIPQTTEHFQTFVTTSA